MMFIYLGGSIVFLIIVFAIIATRRENHKSTYPVVYNKFIEALAKDNIEEIELYGDQLIWNEFFTVPHRKLVFEELDKRVKVNPQLEKVWSDAHFKYYGLEPVDGTN